MLIKGYLATKGILCSDERLMLQMSALLSHYGDQITLSILLIKPNICQNYSLVMTDEHATVVDIITKIVILNEFKLPLSNVPTNHLFS